jgi:hypothetical protein
MGKLRLAALLGSALLALALGLAAPGSAEVSQKSGVRVAVDGSLSPTKLPRRGSAPVSVSVSGEISPTGSSSTLPQLQKLTIAINSAGHLDLHGIPHCRINHINPSTNQEALAACRSSLIGEGSFSADVKLPEQSPFPSEGRLLAFNGTIGGKPAIFGHIYGTKPLPTSFVLPFRVKQAKGTFGTILEAAFPRATGEWGYVTGITLDLNRKRFLSAGCPALAGFSGAVFPLLRTSFSFAGGLKLDNTLTRSCRAKG